MQNPWNKLSSREKKIAVAVCVLLVFATGYHGAWIPLKEKFEVQDQQIAAAQMRLRKAKTFMNIKDFAEEELKRYPNLEQMDAGTDEEETAALLNFIEKTARRHNVSLADVKPEPVQDERGTKSFKVNLNTESELMALIQFVYELQNSPKLFTVEQIEIVRKDDKSRLLRTTLQVSRVVVK